MIYKVLEIREDVDFGCEERTGPLLSEAVLKDAVGEKRYLKMPEDLFQKRGISEGDTVYIDENETLQKAITSPDWTKPVKTELEAVVQAFHQEADRLPEKYYINPGQGESIRRYLYSLDVTMVSVGADHCSVAKCFSDNSISRIRYTDDVGDWHCHAYVELGYVFEGTYRFETSQDILEVPEKEFILIDPMLKHRDIFQDTSYTAVFLCMSEVLFDSVFLRQIESKENRNLAGFINNALFQPGKRKGYLRLKTSRNLAQIENLLARMTEETANKESGYDYLLKGYALRLISALSSEVYQSLTSEEKHLYKKRLYRQVMEYMTEHMDDVTVETLSQTFHFQKDYFNRLLQQMSGRSFTDVLKGLRLQRAANLLKTTDLTVMDIASIVGYQNESYFYRVFAECYHKTPTSYRKENE